MRSETDRTSAIIVLICMAMLAVGCVLGISYLVEYNFYEKGDDGKTAKTIAFQLYSLDDHAQFIAACESKDVELATAILRTHLQRTKNMLLKSPLLS